MSDSTTEGTAERPVVWESLADFDSVLAAAQLGDEWSITVLFRHFNPPLVRYLRAADQLAYEDVTAEVWMSAAPKLAGFEGTEAQFRAWLFTIARNRLIDHRRHVARHPTSRLTEEHLSRLEGATDPAEEVTERLSAQAAVERLVIDLPASQSDIVLLRVLGGFDTGEVAAILGRSRGWVRVNQFRALQRLADTSRERRGDEG